MADIPELLPCPNPWCENIRGVEPARHITTKKWHICCGDCLIDGPWADTCDLAIAAWNTRAATPAMDREAVERKFWLIIREPGRVPDRKGPWPLEQTASILREFMAANPNSFIDYLTIGPDGSPYVDHGPEILQMTDGRSMSVGSKHNARVREAATDALSTLSADAIRQGEGDVVREEAAHLVTIDQRDAAEAALSDAYRAVCGREPAWSNNFSYEDAVREMRDAATPASHASDGGKA